MVLILSSAFVVKAVNSINRLALVVPSGYKESIRAGNLHGTHRQQTLHRIGTTIDYISIEQLKNRQIKRKLSITQNNTTQLYIFMLGRGIPTGLEYF